MIYIKILSVIISRSILHIDIYAWQNNVITITVSIIQGCLYVVTKASRSIVYGLNSTAMEVEKLSRIIQIKIYLKIYGCNQN